MATPPATLGQYVDHMKKFGPEMVLESAVRDLDDHEMRELKGLMAHQERTHDWGFSVQTAPTDHSQSGKKIKVYHGFWTEKEHFAIRKCARPGCGLDIPISRGPRAEYHSDSCKQRAYRQRG